MATLLPSIVPDRLSVEEDPFKKWSETVFVFFSNKCGHSDFTGIFRSIRDDLTNEFGTLGRAQLLQAAEAAGRKVVEHRPPEDSFARANSGGRARALGQLLTVMLPVSA